MFLDLKDSTTAAKIWDTLYIFEFIRDFSYYISQAIIDFDEMIYQRVVNEVLYSWKLTE